jgi:uncharacterized protein YjbI with pentapeptide repeats
LANADSLTELKLPTVGGLLDLRGLVMSGPPPRPFDTKVEGLVASPVETLFELHDVRLKSLDLSGAVLRGLRLYDAVIENVNLDGADCRDFRAWGLSVEHSRFANANLGGAVLGAVDGERRSFYRSVDFTKADLRGIISSEASFVDCNFSSARLEGIDFQSSRFVRCRFAGPIKNVIFWDRGFGPTHSEINRMEDVDFSAATLSAVEFRRLDLDRVNLPSSSQNIIVHLYRQTLDRAIQEVADLDTAAAKRARGMLMHLRKWSGPNQEVGVINPVDLGGPKSDADWFATLLRECEASVSQRWS